MHGGTARRTELAELIAELSEATVHLLDRGSGWPAVAEVRLAHATVPALLYTGSVGRSGRGRPDERRFQNPGRGRPITEPAGGLALLFGVWSGDDEAGPPVLVAMDAYRRVGLVTRFSMFVPVSVLHEARDTGFAEHHTGSGETLYAFRPGEFRNYLARLLGRENRGEDDDDLASVDEPATNGALHIRPKVGMYAAFARLNYKAWFAIAEFVDNSVQSFLTHRHHLGADPLIVEVHLDDEKIVVTDRAAGIAWADFPRAFSPSQPPPDPSGLSEFGLGMKAAACWFARRWSVRTTAVDDPVERVVHFDVDRVTRENIEHLPVETWPADAHAHYTVVTLGDLRVRPKGRTVKKIKEHLASIYRVLMDKGVLRLSVTSSSRTEDLVFERPQLLRAPFFRQPTGPERDWRTEFEILLDDGRRVWGWAGLLEKGSVSRAGFSVFRRDRLIQGSGDETYRPLGIFRSPNSYIYQRLVGDLHVCGFDVSHTKDGIQWAGLEDEILDLLKQKLNDEELPLLAQAEGYRVRQRARDLPEGFGAETLQGAGAELSGRDITDLVSQSLPDEPDFDGDRGAPAPTSIHQSFTVALPQSDETCSVRLELVTDPALDWYGFRYSDSGDGHHLNVWINLAHPFSESYVNSDENTLGPLIRLVAALGIAEHTAGLAGVRRASAIRHRVNNVLRDTFGASNRGK